MQTKYPVGTRVTHVKRKDIKYTVAAVPDEYKECDWANKTDSVWLTDGVVTRQSYLCAFQPEPIVEAPESDDVRTPTHYQVFPGTESIEIIARSMTQAEFRGFCMGNVLKYRLRAGKKSDQASIEKDLSKADFYKELFEEHKYKCYSLK